MVAMKGDFLVARAYINDDKEWEPGLAASLFSNGVLLWSPARQRHHLLTELALKLTATIHRPPAREPRKGRPRIRRPLRRCVGIFNENMFRTNIAREKHYKDQILCSKNKNCPRLSTIVSTIASTIVWGPM